MDRFRLNYIKRELRKNGFGRDPARLLNQVAYEVAYAMFTPLHEQRQPTYGAIITDHWTSYHSNNLPDFIVHETISCGSEDRCLADGANGFFVRERGDGPRVIWMPRTPIEGEAALVSLRDEVLFKVPSRSPHLEPNGTDIVLVQRLANGAITVLHWDGITTFRNGHWSHRLYQYNFNVEEQLEDSVGNLEQHTRNTIRYLLRLCLHVLSPAGCGATIVVSLPQDKADLPDCLNTLKQFRIAAPLTVSNRRHHRTLLHLLGQIDGATVIDERGNLDLVGVMLKPKERVDVASLGGARQLTAEATSKSLLSPIITVSSDGPVRVFHRGAVIADFSKSPSMGKTTR